MMRLGLGDRGTYEIGQKKDAVTLFETETLPLLLQYY